MTRLGWTVAWAALLGFGLSGCSAGINPHDPNYSVFGGPFVRADPAHGRVGSRFSDPMVPSGPSADSNLEPHGFEDRRRNRGFDEGLLEPPVGPPDAETRIDTRPEFRAPQNNTAQHDGEDRPQSSWRSRLKSGEAGSLR